MCCHVVGEEELVPGLQLMKYYRNGCAYSDASSQGVPSTLAALMGKKTWKYLI